MKFSSITRLVTGLLEKTDEVIIHNRISEVFEAINKHTVPMYAIPDTLGQDSILMKTLTSRLMSRRLPVVGYRKNPVGFIRETFTKLAENEQAFKTLYTESFKNGALKEALTYKQVQLLHLLKAVDFASTYARRLALSLAHAEMNTLESAKPIDGEYMEFVLNKNNMESFVIVLSALNHKFSEIQHMLEKIKDLSYSPDQEELIAKMRGKSVDPLSMGLVPVVGDIAVFFGEMRNLYVKRRFESSQDEKQKLELTILLLERKKEGASPEELEKIQQQIDYYSNRINKLNAYIESVEEEVA